MQDKEGKTALHHCIESIVYDKERLSLILTRNPDLLLFDSKSDNIIHYAANCKLELLKALITHIKEKSPDSLNCLLSKRNEEHNTPLYCAIQMKNIPCVGEFLKVNAALPVIQEDGTVTLCNSQPFPHTKVPMCLYDVKLKDKLDSHICVGFELSDKQWILSDLPKLSCTYLTPLIPLSSQLPRVSKIPNDSIDESLLKLNLLSCHCYEPLELVIDSLKDRKFINGARLMHLAASCGTIKILEYLIELYGADIPFSDLDNKRYSMIHYSIENKETQILRILCERMKRDHPQDFFELSGQLLQFCITENHFEAFKILLEKQYSANSAYTNIYGDTLLHLIVLHSRNVSYVTELLECPQLAASEFCNNVNKNSNTALHLAINKKDRTIVEEILKYRPDISIHDSNGNTALHLAIQNSTIDIIRDIVGYIKGLTNKLELINKANNTESKSRPIHLATQRDSWKIVELLLSNGAELYSLDAYNNTILHLTVKLIKKNCFTMTSKILDYENKPGKSKFIHFQDTKGRTPLHLTIEDGCVDCIKLLLKQPINLSLVDTSDETILHYAIRRGDDDIFSLIYDYILLHAEERSDLTLEHSRIFCLRNNTGKTPLHLSIELQYQHTVEKLISQSVCVDLRDEEGLTILHYAAKFQNSKSGILRKIIDFTKGKSIPSLTNVETEEILNSVDNLGRTPFLIAIESTKMFVLEAIINCDPNFLIKDKEGNGVLIYAAKNPSSLDILKSILTKLKEINAGANHLVKSKDADTYIWKGRDDLLFCVPKGDSNTLLVTSKFTTKMNDGTYRICCLLKEPPECQLYSIAKLGTDLPKNLIERVLKFPCTQIHKILLTNKHCSLTSKISDGTPCMHYFVEYGNKELMEFMFDQGLDSSSLLDTSNNSILHTAICKRKTDNAVVILKRCSDKTLNVMLETQNFSKETPLDLAIKTELFSLITSLNHYRPEIFIEIFRTFDSAGNSWFHRAVRDKSKELLKVLTEQENLADYIDTENAKQYTPLMQCVREKFVEGFKILEKTRKCRIDVHDRESYTLLHLAIIYYEKEIFSELLQVIASDNKLRQMIDRRVEIPTIRYIPSSQYHGLTPLLLSLRCQQFVAARLLLENGANINTLDCEGRTFNSYLIETCRDENELDSFFTNTVVTACIHNDVSSLSLSIQYSNEAVFDLLIPKCDLDMIAYQDDLQNTVLSLILSNVKYTRFLKPLLSRLDVFYRDETKRAKLSQIIDKQNKKGETPLSISIISGNSETVSKLLALGCKMTENILHLATKHGDIQMVTCILDKITEVQSNEMLSTYIKDQTPLHIAISLNKVEILKKFLSMDVDLTKQDTEVSILLNLAIEHGEKTFQTLFEYFRKKDDQFPKTCLEIRNPSEPSKIINIQDEEGKTVLHHCIESTVYNKERLSLILATNPDLTLVDSKSNNRLHDAANCKVELLKALITHITDESPSIIIYLLSQLNKENNTPLYCAIQMKNIPCVDEFLKINAALPVIQEDGTVTLCNRHPYPHTKVPMCLYDVKLKDKPDLHICVGFELSDKQWILSDLPKLSCTYLTPLIHNHSQYQHVSKIPNDSIDESLLKSNLLACHSYEPLELVIDGVKDLKFTNEARLMHLAASCGTIQIIEYLIELYGAGIPFSDLDKKGYSIIHYSIENKETQILRILCERMKRDHPRDFTELSGKLLQFCITENHFETFKILLEKHTQLILLTLIHMEIFSYT